MEEKKVLHIYNVILVALLENRTVFYLETNPIFLKNLLEKNILYFLLDENGVLKKEGCTKNFSDILNVSENTGFLLVINSEIKTDFCLKKRQEDWSYAVVKDIEEKKKNALLIKL